MNFGIIVSYIIAGFLMLTISGVIYTVSYSNQEVTTTLLKNNHSLAVTEIVTHDIPKIGYTYKDLLDTKFAKADSNEITFYSDLYNTGVVNEITWKYTDLPAPDSKNPHDNLLKRIIDGEETIIDFGVTEFKFNYYDNYGSTTPMATPVHNSRFEDIVQIEVIIELQSAYELRNAPTGSSRYAKSYWKKRFSPVNLRPN